MRKILRIRRKKPGEEAYWEDFIHETDDRKETVASALRKTPVVWEHSCLQKKCGACAMIINRVPALACDTRLSELKGDVVTIEPLRKFPVVEDLLVDRESMMERLKTLSVWFEEEASVKNEDMAFEASKCLQCGLCLEVCPNFHEKGSFGGMAAMSPMARLLGKSGEAQKKTLIQNYKKGIYRGCGKSLACHDICPAGIDIEKLLVKSNASVFHRFVV